MAKKGWPSKEAAAEAAQDATSKLSKWGVEYQPYDRTDPVTGEMKHHIRRKPKREKNS